MGQRVRDYKGTKNKIDVVGLETASLARLKRKFTT